MSSTSTVAQGDADTSRRAQPPGVATSTVVADVPPAGEDTVQQPRRLPDVFNPEWQREGLPDTEFNRKYPPDLWGEEAAPNARVWKIYRDLQDASHNGMLDGWNKTLDVLLIFAGLFSAVLTAFLIESYKSLQPDYTQYVAAFLYAAAVSNNRTGGVFPALDTIVAPDRFVQTSAAQRWTNGLWFASLVVSLAVALLCILIKQWLDAYDSHVSSPAPSPVFWARRHILHHRGLKVWGIPGLISFLPLLLHLSLFLFFAGLILFLRPLDDAISYSLLVMVSCIATFYVLSLVLPVWRVECPSYTPLLVQALLPVSRAISGMIYVIMPLRHPVRFLRRGVLSALSQLAYRAEQLQWSIRLQAMQHLTHDTTALSTFGRELDGYVLSALINLPTDTNQEVILAACAAVGAVTSTCTMDTIFRNVPHDVWVDTSLQGYDDLLSTATGSAITTRAQLRRGLRAVCVHDRVYLSVRSFQQEATHSASLGIDGLLLNILETTPYERRQLYIDLIPQLQLLPLTGDGSPGFPLRSTCLTFMSNCARDSDRVPQLFPAFLLVFCAGNFAAAERHELVRALRIVETVLKAQCAIAIPAHNGGEMDYISAGINGLWLVLVDPGRYRVDAVTAQLVAYQASKLYKKLFPLSNIEWVHLSGLSAFCRSPAFGQCVSTRDSLATYRQLVLYSSLDGCSESQVEDYWLCVAALLRLCCDVPRSEDRAYLFRHGNIPHGGWVDWIFAPRSHLGPYATLTEWHDPILRAFLCSPTATRTWTGASSSSYDTERERILATLAHRISCVLCRQQRLGHVNDAFIQGFFSGTFLLRLFRDFVSQQHIQSQEGTISTDTDRSRLHDILLDLARNCRILSKGAFLEICMQLEETGDTGSDLRARAVAFARTLRCTRGCWNVLPDWFYVFDRPRATRGGTRGWHNFVGRFRQRLNGSVMSPNV